MITIIKTTDGNYNLLGTRGKDWILQGNCTEDELRDLRKQITGALPKVKKP